MVDRLITVDEAVQRIVTAADHVGVQSVALSDACGRVLAHDVEARLDVPGFDRAMLDGFAVRAADIKGATRENPIALQVIATVAAGAVPSGSCEIGQAYRTMTGAPIAKGADAIVRLEYADEIVTERARQVLIMKEVNQGEAIQPRGHDMTKGRSVLSAGRRIGAIEMGILATHGYHRVQVHAQPRIGVLAIGSELVEPGRDLDAGQIYDSNTPLLMGLLHLAGFHGEALSSISDDPALLRAGLHDALLRSDLLITTGGVSVGDYDLVPLALESLGVQRLFWGVWMRPGTPVYAGTHDGKLILALSGNPAAAYVNAVVLLLPVLERMMGMPAHQIQRVVSARLRNLPKKSQIKHTRFLRGKLLFDQGEAWMDLNTEQSSGTLGSFVGMNALARVEPGMSSGDEAVADVFVFP